MSRPLHLSTFAVFFIWLFLSDKTNAFQTEHYNATVGWTDNPSTRGTLDILYNCFFTIIACTWSKLLPHIPDPSASSVARFFQKFKWMVINIFCAEYMFTHAVSIRLEDHHDMTCIRKSVKERNLNGSSTSDFMGGWAIQEERSWTQKILIFSSHCKKKSTYRADKERNAIRSRLTGSLPQNEANDPKLWTMAHTTYLNMGGLRIEIRDPGQSDHPTKTYDIAARHIAQPSFFDLPTRPLKIFLYLRMRF